MARLAGRAAVVTGGARGIGEGIVRLFVQEGARCVIADVDVEAGERLAAELGDEVRFIRTDVTSEDDIVAAIDACVSAFGALDIMVNNAGVVGVIGPIASTSREDWDRTNAILLTSVFLGTKNAVAVMVEQGFGVIINTSSTAGVQAGLGPHVYTAAKHGVIGLSKSVAVEMAPHGIRVNVICPGATVSSLTAGVVTGDRDALDAAAARLGSKYPGGQAPMPRDIALAAVYLASDEARFVNGFVMIVDAGKEVLANTAGAKFYPPTA